MNSFENLNLSNPLQNAIDDLEFYLSENIRTEVRSMLEVEFVIDKKTLKYKAMPPIPSAASAIRGAFSKLPSSKKPIENTALPFTAAPSAKAMLGKLIRRISVK